MQLSWHKSIFQWYTISFNQLGKLASVYQLVRRHRWWSFT